VCFNPAEGWSLDATSDVADAFAQLAADTSADVSGRLAGFSSPPMPADAPTVQLTLPLRGAAA